MTTTPPNNPYDQETAGGDLHDNTDRISGDSARVTSAASAESGPTSPSLLRQWSDLISRPIASCSGCLTQVEADRADGVDNTVKAVSAVVNTNHSLLDHDEIIDSPTASRDTFRCSELDDGQVEYGVEVPTEQTCPICLHPMSPQDILYPIQCPSSTTSPALCRYNFCTECMSSLLKSSKDDYQQASDGSRRVKIRLSLISRRQWLRKAKFVSTGMRESPSRMAGSSTRMAVRQMIRTRFTDHHVEAFCRLEPASDTRALLSVSWSRYSAVRWPESVRKTRRYSGTDSVSSSLIRQPFARWKRSAGSWTKLWTT